MIKLILRFAKSYGISNVRRSTLKHANISCNRFVGKTVITMKLLYAREALSFVRQVNCTGTRFSGCRLTAVGRVAHARDFRSPFERETDGGSAAIYREERPTFPPVLPRAPSAHDPREPPRDVRSRNRGGSPDDLSHNDSGQRDRLELSARLITAFD